MRAFLDWNKAVSGRIDALLVDGSDNRLARRFFEGLDGEDCVADVGGGKKPAKLVMSVEDLDVRRYDGFDIDEGELAQARELYTGVFVLDLTRDVGEFKERYDKIICRNTLEHVLDAAAAMRGIGEMLKPGGRVYIKVPYRYAAFAVLNRLLPHQLKRRLLHYVFPNKVGDGFPAYYKGCTRSSIEGNGRLAGLTVRDVSKFYTSSYFTFLVPLYVLWRIATAVQYVLDKDYCESFEIILEKARRDVRGA